MAGIVATGLFIALFIGVFILIIALNVHQYESKFGRFPTFDEYRAAHPANVKDGRVTCHVCGGTHMQFRGLTTATDRRKTHFCVTCGTPLYKSYH